MSDDAAADTIDPRPDLPIIGIVGAGIMGSGIAQLALEAGHEVVIHDVDALALDRGRERIAAGLARRAAKLILPGSGDADGDDARAGWIEERLGRLRTSAVLEQLGDEADVIVEAALESLPLKQDVFRALDSVADADTVLATNTSALSVAAIATATARPDRVLGLHFFNPAPVMRLVEVVTTPATDARAVDVATGLVEGWGRTAVISADAPGFIVNRVNRPFTIRALRIVESGLASIEDVDRAIRAAGFPLGPFELMDLTGIDVTLAASTAIWERLGRPDRLRPSPLQEERVAADELGRKTGRGFHRYEGNRRVVGGGEVRPASGGLGDDAIRDRILLPIIDEAGRVLAEGVARTAGDIDLALRLGAAHPVGPFERARELGGVAAVAERLSELAADDPTFTPSDALLALR
jgi:3-hydroxybutyryl-CoA dehydrogenase